MLFATPIARAGSVVGVLGLLVVGLPLALAGRGMRVAEMGRIPLARLAAFAGLGYGYMAVEVATILKLQLYLGQPIYALSLGLGTFLASTALGSRASDALPGRAARRLAGASLVVVVLGLGLFAFAGPVLVATLGLPLPARAGLAVLLLAPLGFAMGMPFPSAVRLLAGRDASFVPWAWAINGCFSVVGIFGTRAAALFVGFDRALLVGLAAYGLVLVLALRQDRAGR
jgi:hypothetical protein